MTKQILQIIRSNFCIYLLSAMNLVHAIQTNSYDWLLWASLALSVTSVIMGLLSATKETNADA